MSENGPREGTRDLPRRDPDAGRRSVDEDSLTGAAYGSNARQQRRRATEIRALALEGETPDRIAARYTRDHPQEHPATAEEVAHILGGTTSHRPRANDDLSSRPSDRRR
jgi:hypothetical protein